MNLRKRKYPLEKKNPDEDLTEDQLKQKKYVESLGCKCPFCGSDDLESGAKEVDAGYMFERVSCLSCSEYWDDVYKLVEFYKPGT
tara:strand:+ start:1186 stop:1440 length:255 start_codon:yes stop_codon:yes gene_type:complete